MHVSPDWEQAGQGESTVHSGTSKSQDNMQTMSGCTALPSILYEDGVDWAKLGLCTGW